MSSTCVCHVEGAFCFYCEVYAPVVAENERLQAEVRRLTFDSESESVRAESATIEALTYATENEALRSAMMHVFQRARNDVARREGGQCYGTVTFADYPFAKRLVRDLQPLLFPDDYLRGHKITLVDGVWTYADTGEATAPGDAYTPRPCGKCGRSQTAEGHDACIANLPGVINACCGHGAQDGYVMFEDGRIIRGKFSVEEAVTDESGE